MSWFDHRGRTPRICAVAIAVMLLAGCIRPLYGPAASGGGSVQDILASTSIDPIPDRIGHFLREDLRFELDGSGMPVSPRYRLSIAVFNRVQTPIVDTVTGRADAATLVAEATFSMRRIADESIIVSGKAVGSASYDRTQQRFANVRAARDAEIRIAKLLAEQIRTRLAAAVVSRP